MNQTGIGMTSARTRARMIERLREQGIGDEVVLAALSAVPRHVFVDEALAQLAGDVGLGPADQGDLAGEQLGRHPVGGRRRLAQGRHLVGVLDRPERAGDPGGVHPGRPGQLRLQRQEEPGPRALGNPQPAA